MEETNELAFETIDLREYLSILKKRRLLIAVVTIVAVLTSAVLSFFVLPPVYETKTMLMATQPADEKVVYRSSDDLRSVVDTVSRLPGMTVKTYVGQVKNPVLLQRVIDKLRLNPQLYNVRTLDGMITVTDIKNTDLIEIKVESSDPQLAADIANTLRQEFLNFLSESNQEQMNKSVEFLKEQIAIEQQNLVKATEALKKFQAEPRSVTYLSKDLDSKLASLNQYNTALNQARIDLEQALAAKSRIEEKLAQTPMTIRVKKAPVDNPTAVTETEEMNPVYITQSQLLEQKEVTIAEKRAQIQMIEQVIASLEGEINSVQAELAAKRTEEDRLQREVDRLKTVNATLADKSTQTQIAKSIKLGETSLITVSAALVPTTPVKPKKS